MEPARLEAEAVANNRGAIEAACREEALAHHEDPAVDKELDRGRVNEYPKLDEAVAASAAVIRRICLSKEAIALATAFVAAEGRCAASALPSIAKDLTPLPINAYPIAL